MAEKIPQTHRKNRGKAAHYSVFDRLLARALVLAFLGEDYSGEISLARAIARSLEMRATT